MLIFNDGPPRAGKSYDAVKNHILPALKKGRAVYARLDGLDHDAIAAHLGMKPERVRELLHHVEPDDVVPTFRCRREGATYIIPEHLRDALVLIDEVHEFYPAGMKPLEREQEQFFARHGQFGMDIVVASQTFDRMHAEIRARVERRVLFRKLSHFAALKWLGIGGKGQYARRFYVTAGAGKFQVIGNDRDNYDPRIFPLYAGFQPGTTNTDVYEGGVKEAAGHGLRYYLWLAVVAAGFGLWFLFRFFDGEQSPLLASARANPAPVQHQAAATAPPVMRAPVEVPGVKPPEPEYPPGVAYVLDLSKRHRIRAAGKYETGSGRQGGFVEFRSEQRQVVERLELEQLHALGWTTEDTEFGYTLRHEGVTLIATMWPTDEWGRVSDADNNRLRERAGAGSGASPSTSGPPSVAITAAEPSAQGSGAFRP